MNTITTPKIHDLRDMDMGSAYDATQCRDEIKSGDFLLVEDGVAVLDRAWPVMIVGDSEVFHSFKDTPSAEAKKAALVEQYNELAANQPS